MGRTPCCDKSKVKRGPWSPEEDSTLKNYLQTHGSAGNWIALPPKAGLKRCGKSCRLRWLNYLRPDIKHGAFTEQEDDIILNLYNTIGSRWSVIASHLQGRTDNDVKNYWNTKMKKKLLAAKSSNVPVVNSFPCLMEMNKYQSFPTFPATETKIEETETSVTISSTFQERDTSVRILPADDNRGGAGDDEFLFASDSGSSCLPVCAADIDDLLNEFDFLREMINSTKY